jgi:hypothetical protein
MDIFLVVIAPGVVILGLALTGIYFLNKSVDQADA